MIRALFAIAVLVAVIGIWNGEGPWLGAAAVLLLAVVVLVLIRRDLW